MDPDSWNSPTGSAGLRLGLYSRVPKSRDSHIYLVYSRTQKMPLALAVTGHLSSDGWRPAPDVGQWSRLLPACVVSSLPHEVLASNSVTLEVTLLWLLVVSGQ